MKPATSHTHVTSAANGDGWQEMASSQLETKQTHGWGDWIAKNCHFSPWHALSGLPLLFRKVSLSCKCCVRFSDLYDCLKYPLASQMIETSWLKQLNLICSLPPEKIRLKREYDQDLGTLQDKCPNQGLSVQDFLQGQGGMSRQKVLKEAEGNYTPHST